VDIRNIIPLSVKWNINFYFYFLLTQMQFHKSYLLQRKPNSL
jgi:hypothetical protein